MTIEHTDLLTKCFYIKPNDLPQCIVDHIRMSLTMSQDLSRYRYINKNGTHYVEILSEPETKVTIVACA